MPEASTIHEVMYSLSIRSEYQSSGLPIYRGTLETLAGQTFKFSTLTELNRLLCEVCGWIDTPCSLNEGGDLTSFDEESSKSGCPSDQNPKEEMK